MSSTSSSLSLNNLAAYGRQFLQLFANLMLVNYLTHGINLQQNPTSPPPQDALNSLFRQALSGSDMNTLHSGTHVTAGLIGLYNVVSQVQTAAATGFSGPTTTSSSSSQSSASLGLGI